MARAFEDAVFCGPAAEPCGHCGSDPCSCDYGCHGHPGDYRCGCGDPHCGGCGGRQRLRVGAEILTLAGFIGEVVQIGDIWVRVKFDGNHTMRVAKRSIRQVLKRAVAKGDIVQTACGFVGEVKNVNDQIVTIESGGTTFDIHRKSICKVLQEADTNGGGNGGSGELPNHGRVLDPDEFEGITRADR